MNEELGGYITNLLLNSGTSVPLNKNDIVVFVGPNNSGKSQSLKDIYDCCASGDRKGIVIKDIALKTSTNGLNELVHRVADCPDNSGVFYYLKRPLFENSFNGNSRFRSYRDMFVSFLQTDERLSYCKPQPNIDDKDKVSHPMQYLVGDQTYLKKLSNLFYKAFQQKLYCYSWAKSISIRVGNLVDEVVNGNKLDVVNSYFDEMSKLPHIENQGDGMRSFTSILLSLELDYKKIHLFDEPESFLHQAQARIIGRMIGEELRENQQAFISTHSTDFIKGLLEKAESRVKIIRITRSGNTNSFHLLDNNCIQNICNDEMLKHTNIMEGLFSNKVIVCESDIDCLLYSSIEEHLLNLQGQYSESLYLFTGGKSAFKKTLIALKGLGIHYCAVLDLDALNDETLIKGNYEVCGGNWAREIKDNYNSLLRWINGQGSDLISKETAKTTLISAIDKCNNEFLSANDIRNIKSSLKTNMMWEKIKRQGREAITDSSIVDIFDKILLSLREKNIFLIPYGEIESFFPDIDGHSHGWLQKVFKSHPTFDDPFYTKIKEFVKLLI